MKYIVDFIDIATEEQIQNYLTQNGISFIAKYASFGNVLLVESGAKPPVTDLVESVTEDVETPIKLVMNEVLETNNLATVTFDINDDNWWKAVSVSNFDPTATTYTQTLNKTNADVYIVDSGINSTHPEFDGQTITNLYSVVDNYNDVRGHGTALASLITGNTCSISRANVFNVKILDIDTNITTLKLMEAFDAVKAHSDSRPLVPAVMNLSWVIPRNDYINAKIEMLMASGIIVVVAAGNNGAELIDLTPACIRDVFCIGAYDRNFEPCAFSNYTSPNAATMDGKDDKHYGYLNSWSPGEHIRVADVNGGYKISDGTSLSAAIFTASVAYSITGLEEAFARKFGTLYNKSGAMRGVSYAQMYRKDILTLNGKYNSSVNLISAFCLTGLVQSLDQWTESIGSQALDLNLSYIGATVVRFVYPVDKIQAVKIVDGALPPGIIISNGWIVGSPEKSGDYQFVLSIETLDGKSHLHTMAFNIFDESTALIDSNRVDLVVNECYYPACSSVNCVSGPCSTGKVCSCTNVI